MAKGKEANTPAVKPTAPRRRTSSGSYAPRVPLDPERLAAEATLEDSNFDPDLDMEPEPAEKPAAPAAPKAATPQHSKQTLRMARDLGLSADHIAATSPEDLDDEVYWRHRQLLEHQDDMRRVQHQQQAARPAQAPAPAAPAREEFDWGTRDDGTKMTEADYVPRVAEAIKRAAHLEKKQQEMETQLSAMRQESQASKARSVAEVIDTAFESLGENYESFLGKGPAAGLGQDQKAEYMQRMSVLFKAGLDPDNLPHPDVVRQKISNAAQKLYGQAVRAPAATAEPPDERLASRRADWDQAGLVRPTSRGGSNEPKGESRAIKAVRAHMMEKGLNGESIDEANLPD